MHLLNLEVGASHKGIQIHHKWLLNPPIISVAHKWAYLLHNPDLLRGPQCGCPYPQLKTHKFVDYESISPLNLCPQQGEESKMATLP